MDKVKTTAIKFKNHVVRNKVAYAMTALAASAIALQKSNRIAFTKFMEEKGIDPAEYFYPESLES